MTRLRALAHSLTALTIGLTVWAIHTTSLWQTITCALTAWTTASFAAGAYLAAHNLQRPRPRPDIPDQPRSNQ